MMHNGRIFKEGTPRGDRERPRGAGDLSRGRAWLSAPPQGRCSADRRPAGLLRREPRHPGRVADARTRRAVGRRPQRHGQDDALQHHHRAEARALRLDPRRRPRDLGARAARDRTGSASAMCRKAGASGRASRSTSICGSPPATGATPAWTVERVYQTFPRLAERRGNGGAQLSGGEQQMLAISRALLGNPEAAGHGRADRGPGAGHRRPGRAHAGRRSPTKARWPILVIEQNIGVATAVAGPGRDHGQRPHQPASWTRARWPPTASCSSGCSASAAMPRKRRSAGRRRRRPTRAACRRGLSHRARRRRSRAPTPTGRRLPPGHRPAEPLERAGHGDRARRRSPSARRRRTTPKKIFAMPFAERIGRTALVAGTFDTKGKELRFIADRLKALGIPVAHRRSLDLGQAVERRRAARMQVAEHASARRVRRLLRRSRRSRSPRWRTPSRAGSSASAHRRHHLGRRLGRHHAGDRRHARAAGRHSEDHGLDRGRRAMSAEYVGAADIMMFHSVADVQGLNSITEQVLGNAAHALAGMIAQLPTRPRRCEARRKLARAGARHHHVRRHHALRAGA